MKDADEILTTGIPNKNWFLIQQYWFVLSSILLCE